MFYSFYTFSSSFGLGKGRIAEHATTMGYPNYQLG